MTKRTGAPRGPWLKFFVRQWLSGSVRWQLEPDEQAVWVSLLAFAKECKVEGLIETNDGEPYPLEDLARQMSYSVELVQRTIVKCIEQKRIETVNNGGLLLINYDFYQGQSKREGEVLSDRLSDIDNEQVKAVFASLGERGWDTPARAKEAKAIRWMLGQGYSQEQIIECYDKLKAGWWADKFLSMVKVAEEIKEKGKQFGMGGEIGKRPGEYTPKWK